MQRNIKRDLMDALPRYYDDSPEVDAIMSANATEIDRIRRNAHDVLDQFYVNTATHGLDVWERVLALSPRPNSTLEFRRSRILARLNGTAPATIANLTDVVNAHVSGKNTRIVEYNGEYRFEAEIPLENNVDTASLLRDINEVKPAHLGFGVVGTITDALVISGHEYSFGVPYRICNMFRTDDARGIADNVIVTLESHEYAFAVEYPICGMFVAGE